MTDRFRQQLIDQLRFIETSCRAYDEGHEREGVRIATCLRVLFHQTGASTSLLTHMNKTNIQLLSTASDWSNDRHLSPMVKLRVNVEAANDVLLSIVAMPLLENCRSKVLLPFTDWWESQALVKDEASHTYRVSRRDIVLWAANKDGGSHVDVTLPEAYKAVIDGLGQHYTISGPNFTPKSGPVTFFHVALLRQIGYEVLNSPDVQNLVLSRS